MHERVNRAVARITPDFISEKEATVLIGWEPVFMLYEL